MDKAPKLNADGDERRVGLEIEYAGVPLDEAADIIQRLFGGQMSNVSDAVIKLEQTALGDFTLELDAMPLKKVAANIGALEAKDDDNLIDQVSIHAGKIIGNLATTLVPFEIVSPPIAISELPKMEKVREELQKAGATDTKEHLYSAFGLHINPEVASFEVEYILRHIQSYLLLDAWLKQQHKIDMSRRVTSFIDPFPASYRALVLDESYKPDMEQLIRDYHQHNPTRNRALDMLPLFATINQSLVKELYGEKQKINKRPTFHYRLPNCELADEHWSFNTEWERWLQVEALAADETRLRKLIRQWQTHQARWLASESDWVSYIQQDIQE